MNREHEKKLRWALKTHPCPLSNRLSKLRLPCVPFFFSLDMVTRYLLVFTSCTGACPVRRRGVPFVVIASSASLSARNTFLISRLIRAASCEEESINWAQRLLSPSSFPCPRR